MNFIEFQSQLKAFPVFSLQDARKAFSDFSYRQLDRWKKQGYLKKIKQGFYCFSREKIDRSFLFYVANRIYSPSYLSLEMALKFYNLIPEEIFQITSVSTQKTAEFKTDFGNFSYRHLKPGLYFGYRLTDFEGKKILLADPEKAILDYLYLNPRLETEADFSEMRINSGEFKNQVSLEKLQAYLEAFGSKALSKRAKTLLTTLEHDQP